MKLFLQIAVYNGGDFWQECWESIVSNIDLIDGVYISFNYSPLQKQDISTIQGFTSEKVKWRKEDKMLSAQEHSRNINRWLSGFDLDGHILVLCHDDILERQGLLKLKEFNLQKNEAVWLGASFFKDKNNVIPPSEYKDIFSEERISSEEFFWTFHERALNVSRCVLPFQAYKMPVCPWLLLSYGYWAEVAYICNPCVEYVRQMAEPGIRIRKHAGSESASKITKLYLYDSFFVLCYAALLFKQKKTDIFIARHIGFFIRKHPFESCRAFFSVQKQLRTLEYYSVFRIASVAAYLFAVPFFYMFRPKKTLSSGRHRTTASKQ